MSLRRSAGVKFTAPPWSPATKRRTLRTTCGLAAWPLAMASVALSMDGQSVRGARVVMGAVAPVPWRSAAAESALTGKTLSEQTAMAAADAAVGGAKPMSGNAYKVQIARTAVKRAIMKAAGLRTV